MRSHVILGFSVVCLGTIGCRRGGSNVANPKIISSPGVMIVDEVCLVSQGYQTDGQIVTVRGSLNALAIGSYALFNSQWDPFYPEAGKDIPRITIRFRRGEKPDDQLGWYVDVKGVITTDRQKQKDGKIAVTLNDAVFEPIPSGKGEEMKLRKKEAQQAVDSNPH